MRLAQLDTHMYVEASHWKVSLLQERHRDQQDRAEHSPTHSHYVEIRGVGVPEATLVPAWTVGRSCPISFVLLSPAG